MYVHVTAIVNEDTHPVVRAISEYHTQLAKMSSDEILDLAAGVYFISFLICMSLMVQQLRGLPPRCLLRNAVQ